MISANFLSDHCCDGQHAEKGLVEFLISGSDSPKSLHTLEEVFDSVPRGVSMFVISGRMFAIPAGGDALRACFQNPFFSQSSLEKKFAEKALSHAFEKRTIRIQISREIRNEDFLALARLWRRIMPAAAYD